MAGIIPFSEASNKTQWADERALEMVHEAGLQPDVENLGVAINRVRTAVVGQMGEYVKLDGKRAVKKFWRKIEPADDQIVDTAYGLVRRSPKWSSQADQVADRHMDTIVNGEFRETLIYALRKDFG